MLWRRVGGVTAFSDKVEMERKRGELAETVRNHGERSCTGAD